MKKGWEYKRLGDITEIKGGKRLPKGVKLLTTPTKHPYIRVADFNDFGTVDTDDIHYISDNVYEQIKRYIIKKGRCLYKHRRYHWKIRYYTRLFGWC